MKDIDIHIITTYPRVWSRLCDEWKESDVLSKSNCLWEETSGSLMTVPFTVTLHPVSLPPLVCSAIILHSLSWWHVTWPLLCLFTESIKLSVQTPGKEQRNLIYRQPPTSLSSTEKCSAQTTQCLWTGGGGGKTQQGLRLIDFYWRREGSWSYSVALLSDTKQRAACPGRNHSRILKALLINIALPINQITTWCGKDVTHRDKLTENYYKLCSSAALWSLF